MPSKEIAEKRYKEGKCIRCGRVNDRLPLKQCSLCTEYHKEYKKEYEKTPKRKEYKKEYQKEYEKTPKRKEYKKEYQKEYEKTPKYKEYKKEYKKEYHKTPKYKEYMKEYMKTPNGKASNKKRKEKRVEEGRCQACGRPLLMGETTKNCKMCNEGQFKFKWD